MKTSLFFVRFWSHACFHFMGRLPDYGVSVTATTSQEAELKGAKELERLYGVKKQFQIVEANLGISLLDT